MADFLDIFWGEGGGGMSIQQGSLHIKYALRSTETSEACTENVCQAEVKCKKSGRR